MQLIIFKVCSFIYRLCSNKLWEEYEYGTIIQLIIQLIYFTVCSCIYIICSNRTRGKYHPVIYNWYMYVCMYVCMYVNMYSNTKYLNNPFQSVHNCPTWVFSCLCWTEFIRTLSCNLYFPQYCSETVEVSLIF